MSYRDDLLSNHNLAVQTSLDRREARVNLANQAYQTALNYGGDASDVADALDELHVAQRELREIQAELQSAQPTSGYTAKEEYFLAQRPELLRDSKKMEMLKHVANGAVQRGVKRDSDEYFSLLNTALGPNSADAPLTPDEVCKITKVSPDVYNANVSRLQALKARGEYKS